MLNFYTVTVSTQPIAYQSWIRSLQMNLSNDLGLDVVVEAKDTLYKLGAARDLNFQECSDIVSFALLDVVTQAIIDPTVDSSGDNNTERILLEFWKHVYIDDLEAIAVLELLHVCDYHFIEKVYIGSSIRINLKTPTKNLKTTKDAILHFAIKNLYNPLLEKCILK